MPKHRHYWRYQYTRVGTARFICHCGAVKHQAADGSMTIHSPEGRLSFASPPRRHAPPSPP